MSVQVKTSVGGVAMVEPEQTLRPGRNSAPGRAPALQQRLVCASLFH